MKQQKQSRAIKQQKQRATNSFIKGWACFVALILFIMIGVVGCSQDSPKAENPETATGQLPNQDQDRQEPEVTEEVKKEGTTDAKQYQTVFEPYQKAAEQVLANASDAEKRSLLSTGNTVRLTNVLARMAKGENVCVAYVGGSITEGYLVNSKQNYAVKTTQYLRNFFGNDQISYVNAGLSGTPSVIGLLRLNTDVLEKQPDLIVVEFAVNDAGQVLDKMAYESLVKECLLSDTAPAVILLFTVTESGYTCEEQMKKVGDAYELPMLSVTQAIQTELENKTLAWEEYSLDEVHPNANGHSMIQDYFAYLFATVISNSFHEQETEPDYASCQAYGAAYTGMKFYNNETLYLADTGGFVEANSDISAFPHNWIWNKKSGGSLKFTMKGRNLFFLYKEANSDAMGTAEVWIDGKLTAKINANSPDGWNNPDYALVLNEVTEAEHEVELRIAQDSIEKNFHLLGIGTTGEIYGDVQKKEEEIPYQERAIINVGTIQPLLRVMERAKAKEPLTIGFLGGSITMGSGASSPDRCYAKQVFDWWENTFPDTEFTYVNAGIGATTSQFACARVEDDLLMYQPDIVIVEFSVNDEGSSFYAETYESLIRKILTWNQETQKDAPAVLLLNMVQYDTGINAQTIHNKIGLHYQLPILSMKDSIYKEIVFGRLTAKEVSEDMLHPNDRGHTYAAELITSYLQQVADGTLEGEAEQPLPEPMQQLHSINSKRYHNLNSQPQLKGFVKDTAEQNGITDVFKHGFTARNKGDSILFTVEGSFLSLQYRKSNALGAPEAIAVIDGQEENAIVLDGNYPGGWGDWLYLEQIYAGEPGVHTVEIRLTKDGANQDFYLVSIIASEEEKK